MKREQRAIRAGLPKEVLTEAYRQNRLQRAARDLTLDARITHRGILAYKFVRIGPGPTDFECLGLQPLRTIRDDLRDIQRRRSEQGVQSSLTVGTP